MKVFLVKVYKKCKSICLDVVEWKFKLSGNKNWWLIHLDYLLCKLHELNQIDFAVFMLSTYFLLNVQFKGLIFHFVV